MIYIDTQLSKIIQIYIYIYPTAVHIDDYVLQPFYQNKIKLYSLEVQQFAPEKQKEAESSSSRIIFQGQAVKLRGGNVPVQF